MNEKHKKTLIHMLGMGSHINKKLRGYRNRYCASVGGEDEKLLAEMAELGLVRRGFTINEDQNVIFFATEAGMDAIGMKEAEKARAMEQ